GARRPPRRPRRAGRHARPLLPPAGAGARLRRVGADRHRGRPRHRRLSGDALARAGALPAPVPAPRPRPRGDHRLPPPPSRPRPLPATAAIVLLPRRAAGATPPTLAAGGAFTAIVLGLAAQQPLAGIFAGILLQSTRPFRVGERVRLVGGALAGSLEGTVSSL